MDSGPQLFCIHPQQDEVSYARWWNVVEHFLCPPTLRRINLMNRAIVWKVQTDYLERNPQKAKKMKKNLSALPVTALFAATSFGQSSSPTKVSVVDERISTSGFRVAIVKPMLSAEMKASYKGFASASSETLDSALGLSLGYASLPFQELGWSSNFTHMDIKNNGTTTGLVRADGNLAYAFNKTVNIKGGLNLSKMTSGWNSTRLNPVLGFQGGLGIQLTKNFGLDLGYTEMNQSGSIDEAFVELKEKGTEIGVIGTF